MPNASKKAPRKRKKIGVYLPETMVHDLKLVGRDLHDRGLGGNLSDVLRLVLTVVKKKGMLDAAELTRTASEFETSRNLSADAIQKRLREAE